MRQQGIHQCAVSIARRWVYDHTGRLIYDDKVFILKPDIEIELLRKRLIRDRGGDGERDRRTFRYAMVRIRNSRAVKADVTAFDEAFETRPRVVLRKRAEHAVQSLSRMFVARAELENSNL